MECSITNNLVRNGYSPTKEKKVIDEVDGFLKPKNGMESKPVITRSIFRTKAKRYLSLGMCARHFGTSETTIKNHIKSGKSFNGYIITYEENNDRSDTK